MIRWTEKLAIGNEQIDAQHQILIQTLGDLYEACSRGEGLNGLHDTIMFLIEYVEMHFTEEEAWQRQYNYPRHKLHKKIHEAYKREIREIVKKEEEGTYTTGDLAKVIQYLNKMIIEHICKEDSDIAKYIQGEQARLKAMPVKQVVRDPLTGLLSENELYKVIHERISSYPEKEYLYVGLNVREFNRINYTYGFDMGDQTLLYISGILQMYCKDVVAVGRTYGDRFGMLIAYTKTELKETLSMLESVRYRIEEGFRRKGGVIPLAVCMGYSKYPKDGTSVKAIRETLNIAMYYAKQNFYREILAYHETMRQAVVYKSVIIQALQPYCLEKNLRVVYQPICDNQTGEIVGCEALLRLKSEEGHTVPPMEFIPLAEENGLINELTYFAIKEVGSLLKEVSKGKIRYISINLSPTQFEDKAFIEKIKDIVNEDHFDMKRIFFEITESAMVENFEALQRELSVLRQMGSQILIDDFGQGYSALAYLARMQADTIKIDKDFLKDIHHNTKVAIMLEKMVALVHEMGFEVLVEGVERIEDWVLLKQMKVDKVQGYFFSKPLERQQILQLD